MIHHKPQEKPEATGLYKHVTLKDIIQLSASYQSSLDNQTNMENFHFSVIILLILFVIFSSFQTLLSPWLGTGYDSLFQTPSSY